MVIYNSFCRCSANLVAATPDATRLLLPAILVPIYSSQPIASGEGTNAEKINCEKWLSTIGKWEGEHNLSMPPNPQFPFNK